MWLLKQSRLCSVGGFIVTFVLLISRLFGWRRGRRLCLCSSRKRNHSALYEQHVRSRLRTRILAFAALVIVRRPRSCLYALRTVFGARLDISLHQDLVIVIVLDQLALGGEDGL